jgi:hypothetical protein
LAWWSALFARPQARNARCSIFSDELTLDASWFITDNWFGPIVIGWSGCLEGFRFALDPTPGHEHFYFDLYAEA